MAEFFLVILALLGMSETRLLALGILGIWLFYWIFIGA